MPTMTANIKITSNLITYAPVQPPSKLPEVVIFLTCIRKVANSNVGQDTGLSKVFVILFSLSNQMLGQYFKLGYGRFLPHPLQFIIPCHSTLHIDIIRDNDNNIKDTWTRNESRGNCREVQYMNVGHYCIPITAQAIVAMVMDPRVKQGTLYWRPVISAVANWYFVLSQPQSRLRILTRVHEMRSARGEPHDDVRFPGYSEQPRVGPTESDVHAAVKRSPLVKGLQSIPWARALPQQPPPPSSQFYISIAKPWPTQTIWWWGRGPNPGSIPGRSTYDMC
jgi:hypothetical protein